MQHNILSGALAEVNTTEGNKSLPYSHLYQITDYSDVSLTTMSGTDIFVMEFDLGHRIHLDRFEYKFVDPSAQDTAVASGISFYYKDESFESYIVSDTYTTSSGVFYTTISGATTFAPRYLKLKHTLADTYGGPTTSGNLYGFKAINNDTIVDFGSDGTKDQDNIEIARGVAADVRAIPIYNSGTTLADALVNLEPNFSNIDDVVSVSYSADGPWVYALDEDSRQLASSEFDHGQNSNTHFPTSKVRLEGIDSNNDDYASAYAYGQYTTPVFHKDTDVSYCRLILNKDINASGHIATDDGDPVETIEIRSHNAAPAAYAVIRELYQYLDGSYYILAYRDRWLKTQAIKESSTEEILDCYSSYRSWTDYGVEFDKETERWAGWCTYDGTAANGYATLYLYNNIGTSSETYQIARQSTGIGSVNFAIRELKLDVDGGMWLYFYCQGYSASDFVDNTGYYIVYFDNEFNNTFKLYTAEEEVGIIDVNYTTKSVWYTRPLSSALYRAATDGTIEVNYSDSDYTSDLGGLAVLPDNNVIFGDGKNIHILQYNGVILSDYTMEDVAETSVDYIALDDDGTEAVWIIDGLSVGRVFVSGANKGTFDFKISNLGYPIRLRSVDGGVWVKCTESEVTGTAVMKFISKENRKVDVSFTPEFDSFPALIYQTHENANYVDKMPVDIDYNWPSLPWGKIATDSYLLPEDDYYQLRITFRRQTPYERYPEFVSDANQEFINEDYFTQSTATPQQLLWGDWTSKPNTDRVYVNTTENQLSLVTDFHLDDPYISTLGRAYFSPNDSGYLEIIIGYKIGSGDIGADSGLLEDFYIHLESVDQGTSNDSVAYIHLDMPVNPSTVQSYCRVVVVGGSSNNASLGTGTDKYEGELRLYVDTNLGRIYRGWRASSIDSWSSAYTTFSVVSNYFNIKLLANSDGSNFHIDYFYVNQGKSYYCTDSPKLLEIYEQKLLEIEDIYPNNSKDVYVRTYASKDLAIEDTHEVDMKVRWRVAAY